MSYPRTPQFLIVEDDEAGRAFYGEVIDSLRRKRGVQIAAPRFARSFEEAERDLESQRVFHVVILDLCIPARAGQPAQEGISLGQRLVDVCQSRDDYPILAVLIITGYLERTQQSELRERLKREFVYAELLAKGGDLLSEIGIALDRVNAYVDVGIHTRSGAPSFGPREEYLLRRAALAMGTSWLDVAWPAADESVSLAIRRSVDQTKVLVGRVLSDHDEPVPRSEIFVFAPSSLIVQTERALEMLGHSRIFAKIVCRVQSSAEALFVVEYVDLGRSSPRSEDVVYLGTVDEVRAMPLQPVPVGRVASSSVDGARAVMRRRARVVDVIQTCVDRNAEPKDLIVELGECEQEFRGLDVEFVQRILSGKWKSPMKAAYMSLRVGAFGATPGTETDAQARRNLSRLFDQTRRAQRARTAGRR